MENHQIEELYGIINNYYQTAGVNEAFRAVGSDVGINVVDRINFNSVMKIFYKHYDTNTLSWNDFTMHNEDIILNFMEKFFPNGFRPIDIEDTRFDFDFHYQVYFIMSMIIFWILHRYREHELINNQILHIFELLYMFREIDYGFRDSRDIDNNNFYVQIFMNTYNFLLKLHRIINDSTPVGTIIEGQRPITRSRNPGSCVICLGTFKIEEGIPVQTSCGHVFHEECFYNLIVATSDTTNETQCPLCRSTGHVQH